jgi:hypothetical protein
MATSGRKREESGTVENRAQRELTRTVGTTLVRPETPSKRRLFGRRRTRPEDGS